MKNLSFNKSYAEAEETSKTVLDGKNQEGSDKSEKMQMVDDFSISQEPCEGKFNKIR